MIYSRTTLDRKKPIKSWDDVPNGKEMGEIMTPAAYNSILNNPKSIGNLKDLPHTTLSAVPIYKLSMTSMDSVVPDIRLVQGPEKLKYHTSFVWSQNNVRVILTEPQSRLANVHFMFQTHMDKVQGFIPILLGFINPGDEKTDEEAFSRTVLYYYVEEETQKIAMAVVDWDPLQGPIRTMEDARRIAGGFITFDSTVVRHSKYCHNCGKLGDADHREPEMKHCECDPNRRYCSVDCRDKDWPAHKEEHNRSMEAAKALAVCAVCAAPSTFHCSKCKTARYCSKDCQKAAWKEHRKQCKSAT